MISDVYDTIVEVFRRYGCPAKVLLGKQWADHHNEPLCVVMWQTDDQFTAQTASVATPIQRGLYINPRPVATRRCGVTAQLWATAPEQRNPDDQYRADLAWLDALVNQYIVALQQMASGIFHVSSGVAADGNASVGRSGLGYDLHALVDIPVIDAPWPTQGLNECSKTWIHHAATANVRVLPETPATPGVEFTVPTPEE